LPKNPVTLIPCNAQNIIQSSLFNSATQDSIEFEATSSSNNVNSLDKIQHYEKVQRYEKVQHYERVQQYETIGHCDLKLNMLPTEND
ncbi:hypothetical protein AB9K17_24275, partial [Salmonella enterica subsp. enterica serovar Kentucky]|uniref:hypothetical protein n=1 Tax=Salmonella enterica TaxID=28901 RepID=UPI003F4B11DC